MTIDELERLARAAWPGGWRAEYMRVELPDVDREPWEPVECPDEDTAAYIAAMNPAVALALIAELREARAALAITRLVIRVTEEREKDTHYRYDRLREAAREVVEAQRSHTSEHSSKDCGLCMDRLARLAEEVGE